MGARNAKLRLRIGLLVIAHSYASCKSEHPDATLCNSRLLMIVSFFAEDEMRKQTRFVQASLFVKSSPEAAQSFRHRFTADLMALLDELVYDASHDGAVKSTTERDSNLHVGSEAEPYRLCEVMSEAFDHFLSGTRVLHSL
jgi:hypothetical protein